VRYRALVDSYRTADADAAVKAARELDRRRLLAFIDEYPLTGQRGARHHPWLDAAFFRAASMLHADAAFHCWENWGAEDCGAHLDAGRRLVDVSETLAEPDSFRRRWYTATALILSRHTTPVEALEYFQAAVEQLPDDVPLLTAAGWFAERLSRSAAPSDMNVANARALRRRHEQRAVRFLAAALAVDPRAAEASIRLARVEASSKRDAALDRLAALIARKDLEPSVAYLARLTLGNVREREGNRAEAERLYREAIALHPIPQSARIALAHLMYAAGDATGAADAIEPLLAPNTTPAANDPWSDYQLAYPAVGQALLDQLRAEVRR
jgi:tetratricopeptide (TPR) repeat protein